MNLTAKEYVNSFYNLFSQYENIGFLGSSTVMRRTFEVKINKFISKSYFIYTLKVFREIGLIEKNAILLAGKSRDFSGSYLYKKEILESKIINEKLYKLEELFLNINSKLPKLITQKEVEALQKIQYIKKKLYFEVFNDSSYIKKFFNDSYEERYDLWVLDVDPNEFKDYFKKIKLYDLNYFKTKKIGFDIEQNSASNKDIIINNLANEIYYRVYHILKKEIELSGYVCAEVGAKYLAFELNTIFKKIYIDESEEVIILKSDNTIKLKLGFSDIIYKNDILKCKEISFKLNNNLELEDEISILMNYVSEYDYYTYYSGFNNA